MPDLVQERLATLPTLSKAALCDLWKQFFHSAPPAKLRRDLMIPILAYRIQSRHSDLWCPCSGTASPAQSSIRERK